MVAGSAGDGDEWLTLSDDFIVNADVGKVTFHKACLHILVTHLTCPYCPRGLLLQTIFCQEFVDRVVYEPLIG